MTRILLASLLLLSLGACGDSAPAGKSTTKLDAVEVQPGTVSDSMIILDDANVDGTAVDNSVPDDGTKKEVAKASEDSSEDEPAETGSETANPDAAAPAEKKTATPTTPAPKTGE